jgi:hypothetical protein
MVQEKRSKTYIKHKWPGWAFNHIHSKSSALSLVGSALAKLQSVTEPYRTELYLVVDAAKLSHWLNYEGPHQLLLSAKRMCPRVLGWESKHNLIMEGSYNIQMSMDESKWHDPGRRTSRRKGLEKDRWKVNLQGYNVNVK